jgi:hypothetical protein
MAERLSLVAGFFDAAIINYHKDGGMRRELEQRPVDTKILREHFRAGLERKMNKLMNEGYAPMGGISTHMNTHTKPVLGIDAQEYTQTMVKYESFEIWVKESDEDRAAYRDEQLRQSLSTSIGNLEKSIAKDIRLAKELKGILDNSPQDNSSPEKSFFKSIKRSFDSALANSRRTRFLNLKEKITANKSRLAEATEQINGLNERLEAYYKANPSVTKSVLLGSR